MLRCKIFLSHPAILGSISVFSFHSTLKENCLLGGIVPPPKSFVVACICLFARLPLVPSFLNLKINIHLGKVLPSQVAGTDKRALGRVNLRFAQAL